MVSTIRLCCWQTVDRNDAIKDSKRRCMVLPQSIDTPRITCTTVETRNNFTEWEVGKFNVEPDNWPLLESLIYLSFVCQQRGRVNAFVYHKQRRERRIIAEVKNMANYRVTFH